MEGSVSVMITILPLPPELLEPLCDQLSIQCEQRLWGYAAADASELAGYCVVAEGAYDDDPCQILWIQAEDQYVADGLLRRALYPFYEAGYKEYEFVRLPEMTLLPDYIIVGRGSLEKLFTGHCAS